ncbi:MAG: hypothetical protein EHM93_06740 [Bacteroidales bacterium]|nr:MAG: hypothetical protein EHM93_06740 [Bacteroidales bacterium]
MELNLNEIKKYLGRYDRKMIANKLNKSVSMVNYVLRGEKKNIEILEECIRVAELNIKKTKELIKRSNDLSKWTNP